jgi:transketolase
MNSSDLLSDCRAMRRHIASTLYACGGGHYGGSLSVVEILAVLCRDFVFKHSANTGRDKLILSKGHAAVAFYSALVQFAQMDEERLSLYGTFQSGLEGHPDMLVTPGVDFSTGSLGQGLSVGVGMALALRGTGRHVWVVLGDGECQEGQIWETAILASRCRISNLTAVVDMNGSQEFGFAQSPDCPQPPINNAAKIWQAFGWRVEEVDGHDVTALHSAFSAAALQAAKPAVVLANTRKGAGVEAFERHPTEFHCATLTQEQHVEVMKELSRCTS